MVVALGLAAARDSGCAACHAFIALHERTSRFRTLGAAGVAYEQRGDLNDGLATYVQMRAIGARDAEAAPDSLTLDGLLLRALARTNTERPQCGLTASQYAVW